MKLTQTKHIQKKTNKQQFKNDRTTRSISAILEKTRTTNTQQQKLSNYN